MNDPDAALVARCKGGDRAAQELLYRRHVASVWRFAWFRTHSREAAAEIVQETFLRVARFIWQFDGRSRFGTWLFALLRSVSIEFARREKLHKRLAAEARIIRFVPPEARPAYTATGAETSDARETMREAVREAIAQLPGPQRDAIVLCELSQMSIRDAAGVLGWSEGRVKSTLFRARRRLKELLKESDEATKVRATKAGARTSDEGMTP